VQEAFEKMTGNGVQSVGDCLRPLDPLNFCQLLQSLEVVKHYKLVAPAIVRTQKMLILASLAKHRFEGKSDDSAQGPSAYIVPKSSS
jgi:hypothetical protein